MSGPPISLSLYRAATGLLEPFAPAMLRARAAKGKEEAARLGERLGQAGAPRPPGALVWLHGASVGETLSLLPFIRHIQAARPKANLLVTSGTTTSAQILSRRLPTSVIHQYIPVDSPQAVSRFLDYWRPDLAVFAESELWPNLISEAKERGVRLALISARITEASAKGWGQAPAAARALLSAFDLILPQDRASRDRIEALGGRTGPLLNLKFMGEAPPCDEDELKRLRSIIGRRKVVLAASTHAGEDERVLAAFAGLPAMKPAPLLILAPRHPERGEAVATMARTRLPTARRSLGEPITTETRVYVADTLGEMGLLYRLADMAVMGGAFFPGVGGHNPLEPARLGVPVVTGEHAHNFADIYAEMLIGETAALQAKDEAELAAALSALLADPARAKAVGAAGRVFAAAQEEAAEQALASLDPLLPAP